MGNGLLLVLAFNNNNFSPQTHSFRLGCEEQVVSFEPQFLCKNIDEERCEIINLQHELVEE